MIGASCSRVSSASWYLCNTQLQHNYGESRQQGRSVQGWGLGTLRSEGWASRGLGACQLLQLRSKLVRARVLTAAAATKQEQPAAR